VPSPFPGMDPFIESQIWENFHHALIEVMRESLIPHTRPRYVVRVEERVYVEHIPSSGSMCIRPDVTVLERAGSEDTLESTGSMAASAIVTPVIRHLPVPEQIREAFLTIRERGTMEVVTVIAVLSPGNKHAGSDGRRECLRKREEVLLSATHLVELDFLRGGERLPTLEPLSPGDYYAFICRRQRRFQAEVYAWSLRQPLPPVPIPLAGADPDIVLDLQAMCTTVYDRAGYNYSLDYRHALIPPLSNADQAWAQQLLVQGAL
jgi:uncharacterized protein DUF4058